MTSENVFGYIPCHFLYSGEEILLPEKEKERIEDHFNDLLRQGKTFTNEELFSVIEMRCEKSQAHFLLDRSNYAHYLYSKATPTTKYPCISVAVSALLETSDGYFALAKMSSSTSFPNKIKFIGGAISREDLEGDRFNLRHALYRELQEETGLSREDLFLDKEAKESLIITRNGMRFFNLLYHFQLTCTKDELYNIIHPFLQREKELGKKELDDILFVKKDKESLRLFKEKGNETISYLYETLAILAGEKKPGSIYEAMKREEAKKLRSLLLEG